MQNVQPSSGDDFTQREDGIYEIRIYRLNPYDTTAVLWFSNTPDVVYGSDLSIFDNEKPEDFENKQFLSDWINGFRMAQLQMPPLDRSKFFLEEDNMVFSLGYLGVENGKA